MFISGLPNTILPLDVTNRTTDWPIWRQSFEIYLVAAYGNYLPDRRRLAVFLHCLGRDGIKLVNSVYPQLEKFNTTRAMEVTFDAVWDKVNALCGVENGTSSDDQEDQEMAIQHSMIANYDSEQRDSSSYQSGIKRVLKENVEDRDAKKPQFRRIKKTTEKSSRVTNEEDMGPLPDTAKEKPYAKLLEVEIKKELNEEDSDSGSEISLNYHMVTIDENSSNFHHILYEGASQPRSSSLPPRDQQGSNIDPEKMKMRVKIEGRSFELSVRGTEIFSLPGCNALTNSEKVKKRKKRMLPRKIKRPKRNSNLWNLRNFVLHPSQSK